MTTDLFPSRFFLLTYRERLRNQKFIAKAQEKDFECISRLKTTPSWASKLSRLFKANKKFLSCSIIKLSVPRLRW
jgi:hypothetical protein